jgi:AraC-like DNA-binding protein
LVPSGLKVQSNMKSGAFATARSAGSVLPWEPLRPVIAPQITSQGEHRWPFDGALPVDVRYWMLGRGPDHPNRYHRYFELLYVHSGNLLYHLEGRSHELRTGDLVVIGGGVLHHAAQQDPVKIVTLFFLPELFRNWETGGDDLACLTPFLVRDPFPHIITSKTKIPQQIFELMGTIHGELPACAPMYELSVKAHLRLALVEMLKHFSKESATRRALEQKRGDRERVEPALQLMDRCFQDPIRVEDAAELLRMSKSNFMRLFKQAMGQSFVTALNRLRVEKACVLLAYTGLPIASVAQDVGFSDQSYFGDVFRSVMHCTPREFQQRSSNGCQLPSGPRPQKR